MTRNQLRELARLCGEVLRNPRFAPEILPVDHGHLFWRNAYNEHYYGQLVETIRIVHRVVELPDPVRLWYEYLA